MPSETSAEKSAEASFASASVCEDLRDISASIRALQDRPAGLLEGELPLTLFQKAALRNATTLLASAAQILTCAAYSI